jgi:pyruvate formate lyase activating enzyme
MTVSEVVREISKDEIFYFHSGGGVTFSGGEPLEQAEFVKAVLLECRDRGIHRALETSFFAPWERVESLLPLLDLVYADLKHPDPTKHLHLTGMDNRLILDNIRRADASSWNFDLVMRIPLVPGINDSDEVLNRAAAFASELGKLKEVEFLAYHRLGIDTYRALGLSYPLMDIEVPDGDHMRSRARFFQSRIGRVTVKINGVSVTN